MTKPKHITVANDVQLMTIDKLYPYINNARTHSDGQIDQIVASIQEFGFTNPVLIDGDNGIIAGHGRLLAAKKLGLLSIPVIQLTHLTPTQKRAYIIADNKLALNAGWDLDLLRIEFDAIEEEGFDISLTGFDADFFEENEEFPEDDTHEKKEPNKTDDGFVEFSVVMEKINRDQMMKTLQQIRRDLDLETLEQSLMALVTSYGE